MAINKNNIGFDWDDEITGEVSERKGGFTYLKPGVYPFTVDSVEKAQSKTGKAMLKAVLYFKGDEGESKVFFQTTLLPQVNDFFMCIGVLKNGEKKPIGAMMQEAFGQNGSACIKDSDRTTDNGIPYSEVHYFIMPDDAEMEW